MLWSLSAKRFVQQNQILFVALEVYTNSVPGIYPIVTSGTSTIADLLFQLEDLDVNGYCFMQTLIVKLLTAARHNGNAAARIFVDISGRLVQP